MHAFVTHNCLLFAENVLLKLSIYANLFFLKAVYDGKQESSLLCTSCNDAVLQQMDLRKQNS